MTDYSNQNQYLVQEDNKPGNANIQVSSHVYVKLGKWVEVSK